LSAVLQIAERHRLEAACLPCRVGGPENRAAGSIKYERIARVRPDGIFSVYDLIAVATTGRCTYRERMYRDPVSKLVFRGRVCAVLQNEIEHNRYANTVGYFNGIGMW
jgi:hypothetical protein